MSGKERATGYVVGCDKDTSAWWVKVTARGHRYHGIKMEATPQVFPFTIHPALDVSFCVEPAMGKKGGLIASDLQLCPKKEPPVEANLESEIKGLSTINIALVLLPERQVECCFVDAETFEEAHELFHDVSDGKEKVIGFTRVTAAQSIKQNGDNGAAAFDMVDASLNHDHFRQVIEQLLTEAVRALPKGKDKRK